MSPPKFKPKYGGRLFLPVDQIEERHILGYGWEFSQSVLNAEASSFTCMCECCEFRTFVRHGFRLTTSQQRQGEIRRGEWKEVDTKQNWAWDVSYSDLHKFKRTTGSPYYLARGIHPWTPQRDDIFRVFYSHNYRWVQDVAWRYYHPVYSNLYVTPLMLWHPFFRSLGTVLVPRQGEEEPSVLRSRGLAGLIDEDPRFAYQTLADLAGTLRGQNLLQAKARVYGRPPWTKGNRVSKDGCVFTMKDHPWVNLRVLLDQKWPWDELMYHQQFLFVARTKKNWGCRMNPRGGFFHAWRLLVKARVRSSRHKNVNEGTQGKLLKIKELKWRLHSFTTKRIIVGNWEDRRAAKRFMDDMRDWKHEE